MFTVDDPLNLAICAWTTSFRFWGRTAASDQFNLCVRDATSLKGRILFDKFKLGFNFWDLDYHGRSRALIK